MIRKLFFFTAFVFILLIHSANAADMWNMRFVDECSLPASGEDVFVYGNYAYVSNYSGGLRVINVSDPYNINEVGYCSTSGNAVDVFVLGNYAYVAQNDSGICIIDITYPENPTIVGSYNTGSYSKGIYVVDNYAYVANYSSGLCILDVSDPSNIKEAGSYDTDGWTVAVCVSGDYAYIADGFQGLKVIDVSDTSNITLVGSYDTEGFARDLCVQGNYVYILDSGYLYIINVLRPSLPVEVSRYPVVSGDNIWADGDYVYVSTLNNIEIIDVSDLQNPKIVGYYNNGQSFYGLRYSNDYLYVIGNNVLNVLDPIILTINTYNKYGMTYYMGMSDTIKWVSDTSVHSIELSYSSDSGKTWTIVDTIDNTGSYIWNIPSVLTDSCLVKLSSIEYSSVYDISDSIFSVIGLSIISPEESLQLERGNCFNIKWESYLNDKYISIYYSMNGGTTWGWVCDLTENDGVYEWKVNTDTLGECNLRFVLKDSANVYDDRISSLFFIIDKLEIISPNGGEVLYSNNNYRIEWRSDGSSDYVNLYYSVDNGNTWSLIEGGIINSIGYYNWMVPSVSSDNVLIKITDYYDNSIYDISDNVFTINSTGVKVANRNKIDILPMGERNIEIIYDVSKNNDIEIKIYDVSGRCVKNESLHIYDRGVYIADIRKGIYFVKVFDENDRLIKQRKVVVIE